MDRTYMLKETLAHLRGLTSAEIITLTKNVLQEKNVGLLLGPRLNIQNIRTGRINHDSSNESNNPHAPGRSTT